jgi:hypothetical protein
LLLPASVQRRELGTHSDRGCRYWVLDVGTWARYVGGDGLEVIFNSAISRLVCGLTVVSLVLARLYRSAVMAVAVSQVRIDAVVVLMRASEAGLGRWTRARVEDGCLG